jgi:5-methylthioadenosine/S-adenosylhomocysteine deaminase
MTRYRAEAVVTCNRDFDIHRPGVVDVDPQGRLAWVGPVEEAPPHDGEQLTLTGLLMPGLINCHAHSAMTLFRGATEDIPLERFLKEVLWPREARLTEEDVYWGMTLACSELLRFGVTTSCEMYFFEEAQLRAVLDSGFRSLITPGILEVPGLFTWKEMLERVLGFCDRHGGRHDLVEVGLGAHSAYAVPADGLRAVTEAALERDALVHIHVAETQTEGRQLEEEHGVTVPRLLADLGVLEARVLAAHSVWLSDDDLRIYREHDVGVAHCPQSNAKLASGIARLADMLKLGLRVGLGTDGPSSNNDLDLWEEMRLAPLLARLQTGDAARVSAGQALRLATRGGAEALGRPDLGALEPGRWADMVLLDLADSAFVPEVEAGDLISHLVWSASSRLITDVWVAGRRVVEERRCRTVDEERARAEVQQRARRLARA